MPPFTETVTIINKSGKVVSTGKHLVNIFKEAKEAYIEKKAALHAEHQAEVRAKAAAKLRRAREETQFRAREDTQSVASSRHSHRSRRHGDGHNHEGSRRKEDSRPPLTLRNLNLASEVSEEGSVASGRSHRSKRSHRSSSHRSSSHHGERTRGTNHRSPTFEAVDDEPMPARLIRRHTDFPDLPPAPRQLIDQTILSTSTLPPPYTSQVSRRASVPTLPTQREEANDGIDMNLAYGPPPPDLGQPEEVELAMTMSRLDALLLEAHCIQTSASAIITNLQSNPEAMAAVALTLAELSSIVTKMGPGVLAMLKSASPAIFALLASPQFLIAGGLAMGVTVVMFGGFKIVKQIQATAATKAAANALAATPQAPIAIEGALFESAEINSIDTWRRGIAEEAARSVSTSVDGEFITPEAMRQQKERIRERAKEERIAEEGSVISASTVRPKVRKATSASTLRPKVARSTTAPSEGGRSHRSRTSTVREGTVKADEGSVRGGGKKKKEMLMIEDKKEKKTNALTMLFKKNKSEKGLKRETELSYRPKLIEL